MKKEFKPYIDSDKQIKELTPLSIILGCILTIIFGGANAYLGLRVGMTISASIPAAVISMGVIRLILKKDSILENNIVQTIGSAGESLAAGAIFTLPVLFLWAADEIMQSPSIIEIFFICICGGLLGVFFMVPLRKALIVKEHENLPYPEGTACAEVLLAGEEGGSSAKTVFIGMGLAAVFKFLTDGFKVIPGAISAKIGALKTEISTEIYPALIGVGYICGPKIASYMFAGGVIGWLVLIPIINIFGSNNIIYPGDITIGEIYLKNGASAIWSNYIRYIGAGAVAAGGIISLIKSLPLIWSTFVSTLNSVKGKGDDTVKRTNLDLDIKFIIAMIALLIVLIWLIPAIPVTFIGAVFIVIFGFFFATVSSRMVGLVGSSNNPVSGMTIATLLFATMLLKILGNTGAYAMKGAIAIGSIVCIVASMAGDTSQDLKTGFLLGATPKKQQIGEIIGTVVAAITIGGVLYLLNAAWGFGSAELSAPQATLMRMIVEGVMNGNLPWALVFIGVFIAIVIEILGISVLPVAIGLYLPLNLSACIMIGGLIRLYVEKKKTESEAKRKENVNRGILYCSGMIAGEGLIGILLAVFAVLGTDKLIDFSSKINTGVIGGIVLLAVMIISVIKFSNGTKKSEMH